jgi:phosphoglycolate phosphatase
MGLYGPAFRKAYELLVDQAPDQVVSHGYGLDQVWEDRAISKWLGYTKEDMWQNFMPRLSNDLKDQAGQTIGRVMNDRLNKGEAQLYPGALETLKYLKEKGYTLMFLSNCSCAYMEAHTKHFNLDLYFDYFYCAGQFPDLTKAQIMSRLIKDGDLHKRFYREGYFQGYVIGDRRQDLDTAKENGLLMVGCGYGFGLSAELEGADYTINSIEELKNML